MMISSIRGQFETGPDSRFPVTDTSKQKNLDGSDARPFRNRRELTERLNSPQFEEMLSVLSNPHGSNRRLGAIPAKASADDRD
jgi:hypothetical protein